MLEHPGFILVVAPVLRKDIKREIKLSIIVKLQSEAI